MKVLIVVDMQNDFIDGSLGTAEAQHIVPLVAETIVQLADKNTVILFTKDTHPDSYMSTLEGKNLPVPHCIDGTHGWELNEDVMKTFEMVRDKYCTASTFLPFCEDHIILKPTFGSTDLQNVLYALDEYRNPFGGEIEEITLMGLCTDICVLSNAILAKATLPEITVNVVADCCAGVTPESHTRALEAMKMCQINII